MPGPAGAVGARRAGHALEDHTADVAVRAWGPAPADVFTEAALAMMGLMYDVAVVQPVERREIELTAADGELLLAAWLNELLYVCEAEAFLPCRFILDELRLAPSVSAGESGCSLHAIMVGETNRTGGHVVRDVVKAATLHDLALRQGEDGWAGHVLLDI
jgi:SHS2 domain-containing protein